MAKHSNLMTGQDFTTRPEDKAPVDVPTLNDVPAPVSVPEFKNPFPKREDVMSPEPTWGETFDAAFATENLIGSTMAAMGRPNITTDGYNVFKEEDFEGYEDYIDEFDSVYSNEDFEWKKQQIDKLVEQRKTLSDAGTGKQLTTMLAAGILDPTIFIPIFGLGSKARATWKAGKAVGVARGAKLTAANIGAVEIGREAVFQAQQPTRTIEESIMNIGAATVLSGIMGGAIGGLMARSSKATKVSDTITRDEIDNLVKKTDDVLNDIDNAKTNTDPIPNTLVKDVDETAPPTERFTEEEVSTLANSMKENDETMRQIEARQRKGSTLVKNIEERIANTDYEATARAELKQKYSDEAIVKAQDNVVDAESVVAKIKEQETTGFTITKTIEKQIKDEVDNAVNSIKAKMGKLPWKRRLEVFTSENGGITNYSKLDADGNPTKTPWADIKSMASAKKLLKEASTIRKELNHISEESGNLKQAEARLEEARREVDTIESRIQRTVEPTRSDIEDVSDYLETNAPAGSVGAAASGEVTEELTNPWLSKLALGLPFKSLQPVAARLVSSPLMAVRRMAERMLNDFLPRQKYREGFVRPQSVEIVAERRQRLMTIEINKIQDEEFKGLLNDMKGKDGQPTKQEFNEAVGSALRRGDESDNAFVQSAARRLRKEVFDPLKKDLIRTGMLKEDVAVKFANSYLTRVYDLDKLRVKKKEFIDELSKWVEIEGKKYSDDIDLKKDKISEIAEDAYNNIMNQGGVAVRIESKSNPLFGRAITMPDEVLEKLDVLKNDAFEIAGTYSNRMVPRVEFAAEFGDLHMTDDLIELEIEFNRAYNSAGTDEKVLKEIQIAYEEAKQLLAHTRDTLLGWNHPAPNTINKVLKTARLWNVVTQLGGVAISSIPDLARPTMVFGVKRHAAAVKALISNSGIRKMNQEQLRKLGAVVENELNTRAMKWGDVLDEKYGTKIDNAMEVGTQKFSKATGITWWNSSNKRMVGGITNDFIIDMGLKLRSGNKLDVEDLALLSHLGIDENIATKYAQAFVDNGGDVKSSFKIFDIDKVTDLEMRNKIGNALMTAADEVINTPNIGTMPMAYSHKTWGPFFKTVFQFKTFLFASHQQTLVAGLGGPKGRLISGVTGAFALGAIVTTVKDTLAGRELPEDLADWTYEMVDRSGILAIPLEINNIMDKLSSHRLSIQALTGTTQSRRFASRDVFGALAGPSAQLLSNTARTGSAAIGALYGDKPTGGDVSAARKMMPFQNLFYLRGAFDELENGINKQLGNKRNKPGYEGVYKKIEEIF